MKGFSIIICCYNSAHKLPQTIEFINRLNPVENSPTEVIIIDNNSKDNTKQVANQLIEQYRHLEIVLNTEPEIGKVIAFARAVNLSRFEYLVVCDDDNWLTENYLQVAFDLLETDSKIGIIGGRGIIHTDAELPKWFSSLENAWAVGTQADMSGDITESSGLVWGAGMVLRKSVWNEAFRKGFRGFLTGRKSELVTMAGEDSELCILAKRLGYRIYYEEKLQYLHNLPSSRLTWQSLKNLWEGFSRSQVYFAMYEFQGRFDNSSGSGKMKRMWKNEFKSNLKSFFSSSSLIYFFKIIYIGFVEDRPGYLPGLEKRKFLFRLKELWRIRNKYGNYFKTISSFRN